MKTGLVTVLSLCLVASAAMASASGKDETTPSAQQRPDYAGWSVSHGELEMRDGGLYHAAPGDSATSYFAASPVFLGDWRGHAALVLEKRSWGGEYFADGYGARGDIVLSNGDMTATYMLPAQHSGDWTTYEVPLSGAGWTLGGGASRLTDVLVNVTGFEIRAEYGVGEDYTQIRGVALR